MMELSNLRDTRRLTRMLIAHQCIVEGSVTASAVSRSLGISVQGALDHLRSMVEEGHLANDGRVYRITTSGYEMYVETLRQLRAFLNEGFAHLEPSGRMMCVSDEDAPAGTPVYLYMSGGVVHCSPQGEGAEGRLAKNVSAGGVAVVEDVRGLINIPEGSLRILLVHTDPDAGELPGEALKMLEEASVVGAFDTNTYCLLRLAGIMDVHVYASAEACVDAAMKGENAVLVAPKGDAVFVLSEVDNMIRFRGASLNYHIHEAGDKG